LKSKGEITMDNPNVEFDPIVQEVERISSLARAVCCSVGNGDDGQEGAVYILMDRIHGLEKSIKALAEKAGYVAARCQ
jgi:hypothetical protein